MPLSMGANGVAFCEPLGVPMSLFIGSGMVSMYNGISGDNSHYSEHIMYDPSNCMQLKQDVQLSLAAMDCQAHV